MRIGTTLHCVNKNEWLKESAVQQIGICNSFEFAIDGNVTEAKKNQLRKQVKNKED